jgi:hypothetical protein
MINTLMNSDRTKPEQATIIGCLTLVITTTNRTRAVLEFPFAFEPYSHQGNLTLVAASWRTSCIIGHYFVFVAVAKSERRVLWGK